MNSLFDLPFEDEPLDPEDLRPLDTLDAREPSRTSRRRGAEVAPGRRQCPDVAVDRRSTS